MIIIIKMTEKIKAINTDRHNAALSSADGH